MDRFKHLKSESLVLWYYELVGVRNQILRNETIDSGLIVRRPSRIRHVSIMLCYRCTCVGTRGCVTPPRLVCAAPAHDGPRSPHQRPG